VADGPDNELIPLIADLGCTREPALAAIIYPRPPDCPVEKPASSEAALPYLSQREAEEQAKADRSSNLYVAGVHRRLARLYRRKLESLDDSGLLVELDRAQPRARGLRLRLKMKRSARHLRGSGRAR
jgi:hypothetical protein